MVVQLHLGHPLGCTGAKLSVQLFDEMKRRGDKYGIVSMCVGTGQGSAGVFELFIREYERSKIMPKRKDI